MKWFLMYMCEMVTSFITTRFICVSHADIRTGIHLFPRFKKKSVLIRAAVDSQAFYAPARVLSKHVTIIGTIACFKPQKNLIDLMRAFESAYHRNNALRLEIIGDGIQRHQIEAWIAEHQLHAVITLHGWQTNVAVIMQHWDIFALSSLWEGLPCAIIEARLLHIPVVTYDTGGIQDVIIHGVNGLVYPQKEWQLLADGLFLVSTDKKLYKKLATYQDNLQDFTLERMLIEHQTLYKKLI